MTTVVRSSSIRDAFQTAVARLAAAGVPDPLVDAELLLAHTRGSGRGEVQAAVLRDGEFDATQQEAFDRVVSRRARREPLQHITGLAAFRHLELAVGPGVFVPRPETEVVAGLAIDALRAAAEPEPVGVDLCTGSGAIALSLATEAPHAFVHAVENSVDAFIWAKENAARIGAGNVRIVFDDAAVALPELDGTVAVVVSNPPYVPDDAIPRDPEVRLHDPEAALYGGADGLDLVRAISRSALRLLRPGGTVIVEHGEWQGEPIRDLLTEDGWTNAVTHPDLTGRDRATLAVKR